jgi:hypothetical protein
VDGKAIASRSDARCRCDLTSKLSIPTEPAGKGIEPAHVENFVSLIEVVNRVKDAWNEIPQPNNPTMSSGFEDAVIRVFDATLKIPGIKAASV